MNTEIGDLQTAFHFTEEDLIANRQGLATKRQTRQLGQLQGCTLGMVSLLLGGLVIFIGGAVILTWLFRWFDGSVSPMESPIDLLSPLGFMIVFLLISVLLWFGLRRDRREKGLARCTGTITLESRAVTTDSLYDYLHVNGQRFEITRLQTHALRAYEGQQMTIYYFPHSRQIASLETAV
mgnify:CR=1 FL=1